MSTRKVPEPIRIAAYAYERSVLVVCEHCPKTAEWTLRSAVEVPDDECDRRLTRELQSRGWRVRESGETCPDCDEAGRR